MNNKPRIHHFVPQFWIKKFKSADGKLWRYKWDDDQIKEQSPKKLMQISDLYTIQPGGVDDTSLETNELTVIDTDGARTFQRVLSGDHGEPVRHDLASFLAAQIMRDPDTLASYRLSAQKLTLELLGAVDAPDYAHFATELAAQFPGADILQDEFDYIRALPTAERDIDQIISALDPAGGIPDLPFTDLIRAPDALDIVRKTLLGLDWHIRTDENAGFILGDAAVLYEKSDLGSGLRTPLSKTTALYLKPSQTPGKGIANSIASPFEVCEINLESAARSRLWLVGEPEQLEKVRTQVTARGFPSV